jgi:2-isopropylmalate synthase
LALANTLYAIKNGAEQAECTIYGIGERAGNCALEQLVAWGLMQRDFRTNIDPLKLYEAARIIEEATGVRNDFAPIVGASAHSHKSGIHQHGVINDRNSYEVLDPKTFGRRSKIVLGPHSGYHGVIAKAQELGYKITKEQAASIIRKISGMVRRKIRKRFSDSDVEEMIRSFIHG